SGLVEFSFMYDHRASFGTQNIFSAIYSSLSSSSAYSSTTSFACFSSKESETYFKKINPSTTLLYSASSILPRNLSAACHSFSSKPIDAIACDPLSYYLFYYLKFYQSL